MEPVFIALFLTLVGTLTLKAVENAFKQENKKQAVIKGNVFAQVEATAPSEFACWVWDTRWSEAKQVEAGLLSTAEMTICEDDRCPNCEPTRKAIEQQEVQAIYESYRNPPPQNPEDTGHLYTCYTCEERILYRGRCQNCFMNCDCKISNVQVTGSNTGWQINTNPCFLHGPKKSVARGCTCGYGEIEVDQLLDAATIFRGETNPSCPVHGKKVKMPDGAEYPWPRDVPEYAVYKISQYHPGGYSLMTTWQAVFTWTSKWGTMSQSVIFPGNLAVDSPSIFR